MRPNRVIVESNSGLVGGGKPRIWGTALYKILLDSQVDLVEIRLSGIVALDEMRDMEKMLQTRVPKGPLRMLLDWSDLQGWTEEAENERFWMRLQSRSSMKIRSIAVVAQGKHFSEFSRLRDIFMGSQMQFFSPGKGKLLSLG